MRPARRPVLCAAPCCAEPVRRGQLMCRGHWYSVPPALRTKVWQTWRRLQNWRGRADAASLQPYIAAYREAVRAARESVKNARPTPDAVRTACAWDGAGWPVRYEQGRLL